jgi:signal transduction histidine kinase/CheY-like chemotaxis protein
MKQRLQTLLNRHIFADELPLDARRMNTMLLFGFIIALGCTVMRVIEGASLFSFIVQVAFIVSVAVAALVVNTYKIYTIATYVVVIALNFILFPLAFFINGGLTTGMPAFFAMGIALIAMLISGRRCGILIVLNIVWVIICYAVASAYPSIIEATMPASPLLGPIDHIGSFLMVSLFMGAVIKIQDHLYARERTKVAAAAQALSHRDRLSTAVNDLATALLNMDADDFDAVFEQNVAALAPLIDIDRSLIWRAVEKDESFRYVNVAQWVARDELRLAPMSIPREAVPVWHRTLSLSHAISGPLSSLSPEIQREISQYGMRSLLAIPAFYQNHFEGFITFEDCRNERGFSQDEIDILRSATMIIYNAMIRDEINASLVVAREEALAGNRAKGEFLSHMSHEIRPPVSAISGMIAIAKGSDDVNRKNECLDKMDEASAHLLGVINDVLDMSKIEANKLELSLADFSFSKVMGRVEAVSAFHIQQKGLSFELDHDARIPDVLRGDDQRISQVITNILSNAIKFTPAGGAITLRTRLLEPSAPGRHLVSIAVIDSGIGISAEQLSHLFEPFQQAESTTSRRFGGTGLGLAISKRIIDLMDGSISVESTLGVGSSFEIVIPLEEARGDATGDDDDDGAGGAGGAEGGSSRSPVSDEGIFAGRRILLAEDIEVNREIVLALMEPTEVEIECAANGVEAVRLFERNPHRYDLILMDMQMPEMDGCDATRYIRALATPWAQEIPIIALTANVFKEDIDKCLKVGMNDHLGKPLDQTKIIASMRTHLKGNPY